MIPSNFVGLAFINQKYYLLLIYNASSMSVAVLQAMSFLSGSMNLKCFQDFFEELYFVGTFGQRLVNAPHALEPLVFRRLQATARATTFTQHSAQQVFRTVLLRRMAGAL
jgi:hypothetical protein|tara:strand:+ start:600 stop:929 length:330 start_codon:yes stop_codon:yes gene_type:complete